LLDPEGPAVQADRQVLGEAKAVPGQVRAGVRPAVGRPWRGQGIPNSGGTERREPGGFMARSRYTSAGRRGRPKVPRGAWVRTT